MIYKLTVFAWALFACTVQSCVSTRMNEKAAWLSNDKMFTTAQKITSLTMVGICAAADKDTYLNATLKLQDRLKPLGIDCSMQYFTDADNKESSAAKVAGQAKNFLLFITPIKSVNAYDELSNPMMQKQLEFIVETKAGEKIAAGLISIDKETTSSKLSAEIAKIIFDYLRKQRMAG
jgi:hypothetical protein